MIQSAKQRVLRSDRDVGHVEVLLIEDDHDTRIGLEILLEASGFGVRSADSGERGFELLERSEPHVVVLDLGLPGMDGFEVLEKLRGDPATAELPVIVHSAWNPMQCEARALEQGASLYLRKPVSPEQLVESILMLLNCSDG